MQLKLWLVRHAKLQVGTDVCYGALDVPVDPHAAAALGRELAAVLPLRVPVLCSPAKRCALSAELLGKLRPDLFIQFDPDLLEMNFGAWQGRRWADIEQHEYDAWITDFGEHRVGGGESANGLVWRVAAVLRRTRAAAALGQAAWITHAGVIQAATLVGAGINCVSAANQWPNAPVSFGGWIVRDFAGDRP